MRIVVLDGHTLNPGDLNWSALEALGAVTVYPRTEPSETVERAAGADAVFLNKAPLTRAMIDSLTALRYVGVLATGFNIVDAQAAAERGIVVTNVPAYGTRSVAQFTFALLLELCHHVGHHASTVRDGRWTASKDFTYSDTPLIELNGLTMGIFGYGRIGRTVGTLAEAFGMNLLATSRHPENDARLVSTADLFTRSDVVSLHAPLSPENDGFVNRSLLTTMKPSAFLINTARGQLVNEPDLADALNAGVIAGAALDVLRVEPPKADNPLLTAKNCLITPHMAWATLAARRRLMDVAVENLKAFLLGERANVVN